MSYIHSLGSSILDRIHEKRKTESLEKVRWCFDPRIYSTMIWAFQLFWIDSGVSRAFEHHLDDISQSQEHSVPTSVDDFLSKTATIFSADFSHHLRDKFKQFDELCGGAVADGFIPSHTCGEWARIIVENIFFTYTFAKRPSLPKFESWEKIWQPSRESDTSPEAEASDEAPPPMMQINLRGRTIKEAWSRHEAVSRVAEAEQISPDWTPSTPGNAPIFYGIPTHFNVADHLEMLKYSLDGTPTRFLPQSGRNRFFPLDSRVAGMCTSFSALRSFLWAVFLNIFNDPINHVTSSCLQKPLWMRNQDFRGVLLLKFSSVQPASPGLSWHQIPDGMETEWYKHVLACPLWNISDRVWADFLRKTHGRETAAFPQVLHGKVLPLLQERLQGFPCNSALLWQTAWVNRDAVNDLNSRTSAIYVISWEKTEYAATKKTRRREMARKLRRLFHKGET